MANKGYDEMIGRAITDPEFRGKLIKDPKGTIAAEGYEVADEVVTKLEAIDGSAADAAVQDLQAKLGDQKAAF